MPFLPLFALMVATFAIGTTEFAIQGLLPEVAADLGVDIPAAGLLVTGYALGVAVGGPIAAIASNRLRRKTALLVLLAIFVVGHVLCATAPDYASLLAARVVASCCHGAFFGIGSVVATGLAPEGRKAAAIAMMWAGIAAANVFGVPAGTALGQAFGWRATFWVIMGLGVAAALAVWRLLPADPPGARTSLRNELVVLGKPAVIVGLALTVCICAAAASVFTFIAPMLTEVTGVEPGMVPVYLLLFGVGGVIGMQVGGRAVRGRPIAVVAASFAANVAVYLALLPVLGSAPAMLAAIFVWGFCFYFIAAPIQLHVVEAAAGAPNLASTLIQSGFNFGNALGPYAGAMLLAAGVGYRGLPLAGAALAAAGLGLALVALTTRRRPAMPAMQR